MDSKQFRMREPKGTGVVLIWDRALISFALWDYWERQTGFHFLSLTKENMKWETIGINLFDPDDSINVGIVSDELVATSQRVAVRRVIYIDPAGGKQHGFITTIYDLPLGAIARLYQQRRGIQKSCDIFKNKLKETKAWTSSGNAKSMQAEFLCLAATLLTLLDKYLQEDHGVEDTVGRKRQQQRWIYKSNSRPNAAPAREGCAQRPYCRLSAP